MGIVTMVSGGIDSTLMSLLAYEEGIPLFPLFIDYGQMAADREWKACQLVHRQLGLPSVTHMDLSGFGRTVPSGITDSNLRINEDAFLPGRNLLFVLSGAAHAYKVQANSVALGLLNPSDHLFPDQTEEFTEQCERIIETTLGTNISVITPLFRFSKLDVITMAENRGIKDTYSCHAGGKDPCGVCIACIEIQNARNGDSHG